MDKIIQDYKLYLLNQFSIHSAEKMSRIEFMKLISTSVVSYMKKNDLVRISSDKQRILQYTRELLFDFQKDNTITPNDKVNELKQEICPNFVHDIQTSFFVAVQQATISAIENLIHLGADVNGKDATGQTSLMYAVHNMNEHTPEIIDVLIKNGANIHAETTNGEQVLHCLKAAENSEITMAVVNKLIQYGADIYASNKKGYTPLMQAVRSSCLPYAKKIINTIGKDLPKSERTKMLKYCINQHNNYGSTALYYAILRNQPEMIKLLVENGADLQLKTSGNVKTPLMEAISEGRLLAVKALVESGAKINDEVLSFLPNVVAQQRYSAKFQEIKEIEKYIKAQVCFMKKVFHWMMKSKTNNGK